MSAITLDLAAPVARAARPAAQLRLTRRGRRLVAALAAVLGLAGLFVAQDANAGQAPPAQPVTTHVVQPGETLWEVAVGLAAPGEDVRDVVAELVELNALPDAGLLAGQEILLPADR